MKSNLTPSGAPAGSRGRSVPWVFSASLGLMIFVLHQPWGSKLGPALATGATTTATAFWVLFPVAYVFTIREGAKEPREDLSREEKRTWTGGRY